MPDEVIIAAAIGALVLIVWVVVVIRRLEQKRRAAFEQLALQRGWTYTGKVDFPAIPAPAEFQLFTKGHSRAFQNRLQTSAEGAELTIVDYRYVTGSGKSRSTHSQTIVHIRSPRLSLPTFVLAPENVFHRIFQTFGYQDIDIDAHADFSHRFLLRGPDEQGIRQAFTGGVVSFYMTQHDVTTEGAGDQLLFYRPSRTPDPEKIPAFVEEALKALRAFANR